MLEPELRSLVDHLRALRRPVVDLMRQEVDASALEDSVGENVPPSVAVWFGWCNGVAGHPGQIQDDASIIPGYNPLSIEEAVAAKLNTRAIRSSGGTGFRCWEALAVTFMRLYGIRAGMPASPGS